MPEPVSYYRRPDTCSTEPEGPPDPPEKPSTSSGAAPPTPPAPAPAPPQSNSTSAELANQYAREQELPITKRPYVHSLGITVGAEVGLGPLGTVGRAISLGVYHDRATGEIGFYERSEKREVTGAYAGVSLEFSEANSRARFDGKSTVAMAEGGALGRFGFSFNGTSASISGGFGSGAAVGAAYTETKTTSIAETTEWGPNPMTRRGP